MAEEVLIDADKVFHWPGPKRKATLFSATLGRLVLTNERLVFLSTGKHDVTAKRLIAGAAAPGLGGLTTSKTDQLDISAVENKGGMAIPASNIQSAELKGMFKVLTITYTDETGETKASTFAPKNGGMPNGPTWVELLEQAKSS